MPPVRGPRRRAAERGRRRAVSERGAGLRRDCPRHLAAEWPDYRLQRRWRRLSRRRTARRVRDDHFIRQKGSWRKGPYRTPPGAWFREGHVIRQKGSRALGGRFRADRRGDRRSAAADRLRRSQQYGKIVSRHPDLCSASLLWRSSGCRVVGKEIAAVSSLSTTQVPRQDTGFSEENTRRRVPVDPGGIRQCSQR